MKRLRDLLKIMLINVDIPHHPYSVKIGEDLENFIDEFKNLTDRKKVCLITNDTLENIYGDRLDGMFNRADLDCRKIVLKDGEEFKNLNTVKNIFKEMSDKRLERFTPVIAFGGGVVGDIAGFAASTYLRGLPFLNIPTSLVAQVDSSVGGKTGVNLKTGKNLVGTFYQPLYVHIDVNLLNTLEKREFTSGMAEVIKHAVIDSNRFLNFLKDNSEAIKNLQQEELEVMISKCVKIKGKITVRDEKEADLRRVLNLGHTAGHGLEVLSGYGNLKHGEGVAIGMIVAARLAERMGFAEEPLSARLKEILQIYGLPCAISRDIAAEKLIETMYLDKKTRKEKIEFVLPRKAGDVEPGIVVEEALLKEVIDEIKVD
ncbi:MAG: 3-dehydroquinate synthase [Elusimicrobiota bacterium]